MTHAEAAAVDGEGEFTEGQLAAAERLKAEAPRIDAALKNFISLKMAEGLTGAEAAEAGAGAPLDQRAAMGCARAVLKALNATELPPAPAWGQLHPQAEGERGLDFMTRLGEYKVVQALWARCRAAGQKPSKLLGRSALRYAYPEVAGALLAQAAASAAAVGVAEEQLRAFVGDFGRSVEEAAATPGSAAELVWAADLRAALFARQEARKAEAAEREQRATTAESFGDELRAALAAQGLQAPGTSSVQVEEVDDD